MDKIGKIFKQRRILMEQMNCACDEHKSKFETSIIVTVKHMYTNKRIVWIWVAGSIVLTSWISQLFSREEIKKTPLAKAYRLFSKWILFVITIFLIIINLKYTPFSSRISPMCVFKRLLTAATVFFLCCFMRVSLLLSCICVRSSDTAHHISNITSFLQH